MANFYNEKEFNTILQNAKKDPFNAEKAFEIYFYKYPEDYSAFAYYSSLLLLLDYMKKQEKQLTM